MSDGPRQEWDGLPVGLRVLAVDDDPLCLKVVERMLRRCNYEVRTAENGEDALEKLREKDASFDLVLSDVYMPDMDGFKLLETIGLELDLPVIMMSSNGETSVVLRGVTHGAVDFLIKPVRIEEIRNVWQHVVRRRSQEAHPTPILHSTLRDNSGEEDGGEAAPNEKKRKEAATSIGPETEDNASTKKPRVVWSVEMHQQFVNAVNSLGIDKAVPKRILDQMDVEGLTRENVASHLQKYRLYLKRVSGVQVQPAGSRGRFSRNHSIEPGQMEMRMMPSHLEMAGAGPSHSMGHNVDGLDDRESLLLRMPMGQIPAESGHARVQFSPRQSMDGLAPPDITPLSSTLSSAGIASGMVGVPGDVLDPASSPNNYMPMRASTNYNGMVPIEPQIPQQPSFDRSSISPMTGSNMYGDYQPHGDFPQHGSLEDLSLDQSGHQDLIKQEFLEEPHFGSTTNLHTSSEQDMEKFINAFLQPPT